jgi:hypothetical protein
MPTPQRKPPIKKKAKYQANLQLKLKILILLFGAAKMLIGLLIYIHQALH